MGFVGMWMIPLALPMMVVEKFAGNLGFDVSGFITSTIDTMTNFLENSDFIEMYSNFFLELEEIVQQLQQGILG